MITMDSEREEMRALVSKNDMCLIISGILTIGITVAMTLWVQSL